MGADIESPDILYTVVVHRIRVQQRLVLISIRRGLPRSAWGWALYSLEWRVSVGRGIILKCSGAGDCRVGHCVVLPHLRAYAGWWAVGWMLSGALGATGCAKDMSKHIKNKCIPFYAHERAIESVDGAGSCLRWW